MTGFPTLCQTVLDTTDARALAEFYRELLGLRYRAGDEVPDGGEVTPRGGAGGEASSTGVTTGKADSTGGTADDAGWLVLLRPDGTRALAFQQVETLRKTTWPSGEVPMQMHLDMTVPDVDELRRQRVRCEELGATLLRDGSTDLDEPIYVFADPAGHPFCVFVAKQPAATS